MVAKIVDRVRDTWSGTGTGAMTVSGTAPAGYRSFASVGANTDTFHVLIVNQDVASEWEVTNSVFNGTTGLTRPTPEASSNAGALVAFTAGTKSVVHITSAAHINNPELVAPQLGTPVSGNLASCTGLPIATGVSGLGAGVATFLGVPSSANLLAAMTTETGTGNVVFSDAPTFTGTITAAAANFSGAVGHTNTVTVTSAAAAALAVGRQGATNPALVVDASTATSLTGLQVKSANAAAGVALAAISSGTNENLTLDAKGSGTITINGTGTGAITLSRATTISGALTYGGVALNAAVTGTGNMVLSASPTFTGNITSGTINNATLDNTAWSQTTPTVTAGSGTFTSVSSIVRVKQIGKTVFFTTHITITTNGTAAGDVRLTLPIAQQGGVDNSCLAGCNSTNDTALMVRCFGSVLIMKKYDASYPGANSTHLYAAGCYEAA